MQNSCDLNDKTLICVKNEHNSVLTQNVCDVNDIASSNTDQSTTCFHESAQSNIHTLKNSSTDKSVDSDLSISTNQCSSAEKRVTFSDDCNIQSSICSEGNCTESTRSDSSPLKKETSALYLDTKDVTELGSNNSLPKVEQLPKDNVHKILSDDNSVPLTSSESTKNHSSNSVLQYHPESHSSVPHVKNFNVSDSVPVDSKTEQTDVSNLPIKVLPEISNADSEILGCNSCVSDINIHNSNNLKSSEFSDLETKPPQLTCENSNLILKTTCASATQKRKVGI